LIQNCYCLCEGYPEIVGVSAKGKVFEGEQVPVNKRMMEKEDAEQISEEERKNVDEEKQRAAFFNLL
jgi:hypothetical protein